MIETNFSNAEKMSEEAVRYVINPLIPLDYELTVNPDNIEARLTRAKIYQNQAYDDQAIQDYDHVIKLDPSNMTAWTNRQEIQKKHAHLRNYYRENYTQTSLPAAVSGTAGPRGINYITTPTQPEPQIVYGDTDSIFLGLQLPMKSYTLDSLNYQLAEYPDNMTSLLVRAEIYEKEGRINKAIQDYQHILSLYPANSIARERLDYLTKKEEF